MSRQTEDILFGKLTGELPLYDDFSKIEQRQVEMSMMEQRRAAAEANRNPGEEWRNEYFDYVNGKIRDIDANRVFESSRPQGGRLKVAVKRLVRKLCGWYVEPAFARQTAFNNAVTPVIGRMQEMHKHTDDRVRSVEERVSAAETVLSGLDADRVRLVSEERAFRERLETLSGIRVTAAEQKLSLLGTELTHLREETEEKSAETEGSIVLLENNVSVLEESAAAVKEEVSLLENNVSTLEESTAAMKENVSLLGDSTRELRDILTSVNEEKDRLCAGQAAAEERIAALTTALSDRERENSALRGEVEQLKGAVALLETSLQSMSTELVTFNETAKRLRLAGTPRTDERLTASQSGEDSIAEYVFRVLGIPPEKRNYLDLGANHAVELSNTWRFYRAGARGVLVEANPALIGELKFYRSEDVILNCCVTAGDEGGNMDFYVLNGDGLCSCDYEQVQRAIAENPALTVDRVISVPTRTVTGILEQYFDEAPAFLNVDLEGIELEILKSMDWERWRPLLISVETIPYRTHLVVEERETEAVDFLKEQGYTEYAFTGINTLMLDRRQLSSEVLK